MATDEPANQPTDIPRALATTVYLHDEDGRTTTLRAGTVPTPEQAARITNPSAWASQPLRPVG